MNSIIQHLLIQNQYLLQIISFFLNLSAGIYLSDNGFLMIPIRPSIKNLKLMSLP